MKEETMFDRIDYLAFGNKKQKRIHQIITEYKLLEDLQPFDPIVVGTIPIGIDVENSDLDIICCFADQEQFTSSITESFLKRDKFEITRDKEKQTTFCKFMIDEFEVEIFGQTIPTKLQNGYRHMIIEHKILLEKGNSFRKRIIALKQQGYKTEPAFALELELKGNPYISLLEYGQTHDL